MYKRIRSLHLFTGMSLLIFVVMYFVTGYVMIHRDWFGNPDPASAVRTETLEYTGDETLDAWAVYLQNTYGLTGQIESRRRFRDGRMEIVYLRPGTVYRAEVSADRKTVRITENKGSWQRTMILFHRLHGYHGTWLYILWAVMFDLASISLIVFALTGIYMWYKLTVRRLAGWIMLGLSYSFTGGYILYLLYAP